MEILQPMNVQTLLEAAGAAADAPSPTVPPRHGYTADEPTGAKNISMVLKVPRLMCFSLSLSLSPYLFLALFLLFSFFRRKMPVYWRYWVPVCQDWYNVLAKYSTPLFSPWGRCFLCPNTQHKNWRKLSWENVVKSAINQADVDKCSLQY